MLFLLIGLVFCELSLIATGVYVLRRRPREKGLPLRALLVTDERMAMVAVLTTAAGSQIASLFGQRWRGGPEYGVMAFDIILSGLLLLVVHRSRKFWPLWAAAAQLVGTITHGVRWLNPSLAKEVYAGIQPFWVFPVLLAIIIGTSSAASKRSG